jgi:serine/threonine protein phosphatase PrpC
MRHALTNVVGTRAPTEVHVMESALGSGDIVLMTTDGVHEVLDDQLLAQLLRQDEDPTSIAQTIVATALARGSRDNLTAVVLRPAS